MEEKNQPAGRLLFGEVRLDCPALQDGLARPCDDWSDFRNFFRPCKMLVEKRKRDGGNNSALDACRRRRQSPADRAHKFAADSHGMPRTQEK